MNGIFLTIVNILVFLALTFGLFMMQKKYVSFTKRVLLALFGGIVFGAILQLIYGPDSEVVIQSNTWISIVGTAYVRLLKMIVIPLVFVAITGAIIKQSGKDLGKMAGIIILVLVLTTGIAALVGVGTASIFDLSAEGLEVGENESQAADNLENRLGEFTAKPIPEQIVEIIPTNPFYAMTGQGSSATLSVVLFAAFISVATLGLKRKKPESAEHFVQIISTLQDVVMRMVTLILRLTPYGVLALMTGVVSTSNFSEIARLFKFVLASYVALIVMFIIHFIILALLGLNPMTYVKKSASVLTFAFTSRTSAGAIPLNVETQTQKFGVSEGHANLSASLGSSIGQNGCAGIYPAMLAVMIAPTVGIDPLAPVFLIKLVIVIALSSFGIAGVGGGATFAALIVLSTMGLPVGLVGLLIAIEPLIDMGRTAVNVSGSMVAGLVSSKMMDNIDMKKYNEKQEKQDKEYIEE